MSAGKAVLARLFDNVSNNEFAKRRYHRKEFIRDLTCIICTF